MDIAKPPPLTKKRYWNKNLVLIILIIIGISSIFALIPLIIKGYVFQAYKIPSGAMEPTLLIGDHILVNKSYSSKNIKRGDIIVFIYPIDPRKDFVKRVIGLPGDKIELRDNKLFIDNDLVEEKYIFNPQKASRNRHSNFGPVAVPFNSLFVLGDNRDNSYDSRFWGFVNIDKVKGKVTKIYWSWNSKNKHVRWQRIGNTVS